MKLPLTTQLFPFLFVASRRMTTREMSSWLEQTKGVKLSAAGISKGLRRPDLHLRRIAEHVHPLASYLAALYHHLKETAESILFDDDPATGRPVMESVSDAAHHDPDGVSPGVLEALQVLDDLWRPIPEEVKIMCRPYFDFGSGQAGDESDDDQTT